MNIKHINFKELQDFPLSKTEISKKEKNIW